MSNSNSNSSNNNIKEKFVNAINFLTGLQGKYPWLPRYDYSPVTLDQFLGTVNSMAALPAVEQAAKLTWVLFDSKRDKLMTKGSPEQEAVERNLTVLGHTLLQVQSQGMISPQYKEAMERLFFTDDVEWEDKIKALRYIYLFMCITTQLSTSAQQ